MYEGIASSPMLVVLVVIGLIAIILFSLVFFLRAYKRCREFGMSKEALMRIIRSSLIFSIVPSIAIVIGLFTLSAVFGIIWPWWRLSVIGSVAYELMAGQTAAEALHGEQTATAFIAIMFAMTLGMTANIVAPIIVGKKLGSGVKKTEGENPGWKLVLNVLDHHALRLAPHADLRGPDDDSGPVHQRRDLCTDRRHCHQNELEMAQRVQSGIYDDPGHDVLVDLGPNSGLTHNIGRCHK